MWRGSARSALALRAVVVGMARVTQLVAGRFTTVDVNGAMESVEAQRAADAADRMAAASVPSAVLPADAPGGADLGFAELARRVPNADKTFTLLGQRVSKASFASMVLSCALVAVASTYMAVSIDDGARVLGAAPPVRTSSRFDNARR